MTTVISNLLEAKGVGPYREQYQESLQWKVSSQ